MRLVSRFIARFSIFIIIFISTGSNKLKVFGSNKTDGPKQDRQNVRFLNNVNIIKANVLLLQT